MVVPCRDDGEFLAEAIASVATTTTRSHEIVIVNDGSTEAATLDAIERARESGCRVLNTPPGGLSRARNRGIEAARGRYILPLDSDDRLRGGFIDEALDVLSAHPDIGVVYGPRMEFGERSGLQTPPEPRIEALLWGNTLHATCVYRKELWRDVGGYDPALVAWEDWEFWIHALARGWRFHGLDRVTFDYRTRRGSLVSVTEEPKVVEEIVLHVVAKHRELFDRYLPDRIGPLWVWPAALERRISELEGAARQSDRLPGLPIVDPV